VLPPCGIPPLSANHITPAQVKEARKLLGWSQEDLAGPVGVSKATIGALESGRHPRRTLNLSTLRAALESAGVEFTKGGRPGARLKVAGGTIRASWGPPPEP